MLVAGSVILVGAVVLIASLALKSPSSRAISGADSRTTPSAVVLPAVAAPSPPNTPTSEATSELSASAAPADSYTNQDQAYCQTRGYLVQIAESSGFTIVICNEEAGLTYYGADKTSGLTIRLPATKTTAGYSAYNSTDPTTYEITPQLLRVSNTSGELAAQPIIAWWSPATRPDQLPGDLGLPDPISYPACDKTGIVIFGTSYLPANYRSEVRDLLTAHPGSKYLRTDLSCGSFRRPSADNSLGNFIYVVYSTVGKNQADVCAAIASAGTYGKWLENDFDPTQNVVCN
ncbi:MAG: hypothetical protein M3017_14170 [Actinomycetota bacterium]|nr:hypothetical protein [Actinomycetota bacterium]